MKKTVFALTSLFFAFTLFFSPAYAAVAPGEIAGPGPRVALPDSASLKSAMADFKSLSHKEKKERFKDVKKELKAYKAAKKSGGETSTNTLLLVILAIILPPLAVYLHQGEINSKFWIDLLLTLLFWLPGVIYALIVILGAD
ncbi:YqaE/Pmp3 family membrane protein [Ferruginibacter sp. SUN106]|uniref:YqaE/Pmp3 family membrane protein n=1 Tax=Ferruginibacter sp. SUN106 TaxID=2978348 RepID=UPI003D35F708